MPAVSFAFQPYALRFVKVQKLASNQLSLLKFPGTNELAIIEFMNNILMYIERVCVLNYVGYT